MSDDEKQSLERQNINKASSSLMKINSFKNINEETIKDIDFLTEAFKNIFSTKIYTLYFDVEQKDNINNYFKNVLNQIIFNALQQQIKNENLVELLSNFFASVIKLLFIYEINPYPELPKLIEKIFSGMKENCPYFSKVNGITFWQFNKKYCSDFIKNIEQKIDFKVGHKVEVLVENYKKKGMDRLLWMEGIIKKIENGIYYILYNGEDDQNNEILYPIGYPTVRFRNYNNWNWRLTLKKGDNIYAYKENNGNNGKWIISTIIDVIKENEQNGIPKIKYKVGFRIYIDSDRVLNFLDKKEEINQDGSGKSFLGENTDEYIYHYSKRIQKIGIFNEGKIKENQEFSFTKLKDKLSEIILYNKDENYNIIIGRIGTFSYNFATLLKTMEKENIFKEFLNVLNDDNIKNPEIIYLIYFIFFYSLDYLHTNFIKEKIEIFKKCSSRILKMDILDKEKINIIKEFLGKVNNISGDLIIDLGPEIESEKTYSENNSNIFSDINNISKIKKLEIEDILEMIKNYQKLDEENINLLIDYINKEENLIKIIDNLIDNKEQKLIELLINAITKNKITINKNEENSFDKAKNKFEICKIYFEIIVKLNELDLTHNYFAIFLNSVLNNKYNLQFELFELYKDNLDVKSHCLFSFKLLISFFKSDIIKKNILIDQQNFYIAEYNRLTNYLSDKNRPLIKTFEENFKNFISIIKKNINYSDKDKIYYEDNIKERLNFLDILIEIYPDYNFVPLFKFILLLSVPEVIKYVYKYIEKYFDENMNKSRNNIFLELADLINLNKKEKIYSSEEAKIYIRLVYYKNKKIFYLNIIKENDDDEHYEIKFNYEKEQNKEFIFDIFWNLLFEVDDEKIIKKIVDILLQIYNGKRDNLDIKDIIYKISDKLDESDYQNQYDIKIIQRCYELLKILFIETEKDLNIDIKPHFSLLKNCIIKFPLKIINKEEVQGQNKIELFYGNTTLYEVKELLGKKYGIYTSYIETYIKKGENKILLDYTYNHKSLYEIIKEFEIINDNSPMTSHIYFSAKDAFFLQGNELLPKLKYIIEESFYNATNFEEIMQPKHFQNFMNPNIKNYFKELNEKNKKDYFTKEEIFEYYIQKIKSGKEDEIKTDLKHLGYNNYLISPEENENEKKDKSELFRYHLSYIDDGNINNNFLNDFIQNYNNINQKIDYNLFFFLPTSEYYYNKFLKHEDKFYKEINEIFIDKKQVLLQLYFLIIIESFLQDIEWEYIDINDIFDVQDMEKLELLSSKYKPFDDDELISKKRKFIEKFINEDNYGNLINYAITLLSNDRNKDEKIYKECLVKNLKIIKAIYLSLIKKNNLEIKSFFKKEKNIYYFDYRNIHQIKDRNNIKVNPNLPYLDLVKNLINCITSNYINNKTNFDLSLFEDFFELIILIISSRKNIISNLEENNKSIFSNIIKGEIISNSIFVVDTLLNSLNYISEKPSESQYAEYLYDIFLSIYSSINDRIIKKEINYKEFLFFFVEFIKFLYNDDKFIKKDLIYKLLEILIKDSKNSTDKILSDELFCIYLSIINDYLINIEQIRKIIFSFKIKNDTLISSIYDNIINESTNKFIKTEIIDDEEFIIFNSEITNKKEIQKICQKLIITCFQKEQINNNSIIDLARIYTDINELDYEKRNMMIIEKKICRYVGLKNLSSTCYMNSVLQQIFMIYILKYAIIGASKISKDDRILKELQIVFSYLELSDKQYYNPTNLCKTNIFNNRPIDVRIQQDCKEFYDSFCESLEKCLINTKYKYIVNDALMGYTYNWIKCESCDYTSSLFESFYDLSLEVKGIDNLHDSLKYLIKEEKVEDFKCDNCLKIGNIRKRITLSKLPNTLFFHLKRFTYDSENVKIYSEFRFPFEINLKEYCTESHYDETNEIYQKTDDYYNYILKGVVRHSGSAKGGHYISFIDVDRDGRENTLNINNDINKKNWIQFNDSIVSEFNINNLPEETIGNNSNSKTAYLLIYERIKKSPIKIIKNIENVNMNKDHQNIINNNEKEIFNKKYDIYSKNSKIKEQDLYKLIFHNKIKIKDKDEYYDEYYQYIPYYSITKEIPKNIYNTIMKENRIISFDLSYTIYDKFSKDIENYLSNSFYTEDSLKDINDKYVIIIMIISKIFNRIKNFSMRINKNDINKKLDKFKNIINQIISSKDKPEFSLLLKLLSLIVDDERKLDIIFLGNNSSGNEVFNEDNIILIQKLIVKTIEFISQSKNEYKIEERKINKLVNTLEQYFKFQIHMKKNDKNDIFKDEENVINLLQNIKNN